jgi:hypothetical protein
MSLIRHLRESVDKRWGDAGTIDEDFDAALRHDRHSSEMAGKRTANRKDQRRQTRKGVRVNELGREDRSVEIVRAPRHCTGIDNVVDRRASGGSGPTGR